MWKLGANGVCEQVINPKALHKSLQYSRLKLTYPNLLFCAQVIECLRRHPHNSRLAHDGFLAVCHLTTFEENRARFAVPGVAAALVAAGRVHLRNPQVDITPALRSCRQCKLTHLDKSFDSQEHFITPPLLLLLILLLLFFF